MRRCNGCNRDYSDDQFYCLQCGMSTEEVIIEDSDIDDFRIKENPYPLVIEFIIYLIYFAFFRLTLGISIEVAIAIQIIFVIIFIVTLIFLLRIDYNKEFRVKSKRKRIKASNIIFDSQILTLISFNSLAIYIFILFSPVFWNSIFLFGVILITYSTLKKIICEEEIDTKYEVNRIDIVRTLFLGIAILGFTIFFGLCITLGGSAAGDSYASWKFEDYEIGQYYLSSHGRFTLVSYTTWIRMKILEQIIMSVFSLAIVWNFIHFSKTKGIKYMLTGKSRDIKKFGSKSTLIEWIGFSLLTVFMLSIVIGILFTLF